MDTFLFKIDQIKFKDVWFLRLDILDTLEEIQGKYKARFVLNEKPYKESIATVELKIKNRKDDPTLLKDEDDAVIEELEKDLSESKKSLEKAQKLFEPIEFWAEVQEVKFIYPKTRVEFRVASKLVITLIERFNDLDFYALELNKA